MSEPSSQRKWKVEFDEPSPGNYPVRKWMNKLSDQKFAAVDAAINQVLAKDGLELAESHWLTPIGNGLYEFRIRHSKEEIENLFRSSDAAARKPSGKKHAILLRVFIMFYGDSVILLVNGYDKGKNPSKRRQQREIKKAKKALTVWKEAQKRKKK